MRLGMGLRLYDIVLRRLFGGSTLLNGLVSYWALDESGGVRYDSVGDNDLTDNNTVLYLSTVPSGVFAYFNRDADNGEYFSYAGKVTPTSGSWTLAGWVYRPGTNDALNIYGEYNISITDFYLDIHSTAGVRLVINDSSSGSSYANILDTLTPDPGWVFIVAAYDSVQKKAYLRVNDTYENYGSALTNGPKVNGTQSNFSRGGAGYGHTKFICGRWGLWSRLLTSAEITSLFNNGKSKAYADLSSGEKTGLTSWWDMGEASGVRYDSVGGNDFTDYNTVPAETTSGSYAKNSTAAWFVRANLESLSLTAGPHIGAEYTFSAWVKSDLITNGLSQNVVSGHNGYAHMNVYAPYSTGSTIYAEWSHFNTTWKRVNSGTITIAPYVWHHYVAMARGNVLTMFVDGAKTTGDTTTGPPDVASSNYTLKIGNANASLAVGGLIDEVAYWSRALTDDEVAELYAAGAGKFYPFSE